MLKKDVVLDKASGIPISLDLDSSSLDIDSNVIVYKNYSERKVKDCLDFYIDSSNIDPGVILYKMYRGIYRKSDRYFNDLNPIRFDITILLPGKVHEEYFKTIGHIHPTVPGNMNGYRYPEIYSVIYGTAYYIIQKYSSDFRKIVDIYAICVNEGEHIVIPPGYGHVTVNTKNKPLVMANLIEKTISPIYTPYKDKQGAALYIKSEPDHPLKFVPNANYVDLPTPCLCSYKYFTDPNLVVDVPLYTQFLKNPTNFSYLYKEA